MKRRKLDAGFHLLYEQKPVEARALSEAWLKSHPADPLLSALGAASYLFEECYRQSVSPSEFFFNDKRFLGKIPFQTGPRAMRGILRCGQTGAGLGPAPTEGDGSGPHSTYGARRGVPAESLFSCE
jgi:hypothetical protein